MQRTTYRPPIVDSPVKPAADVLLGRYRVLEVNTVGGFGSVNICWDARLQRRVAIKRIPLRLDADSPLQASTVEEALAEARTASMLAHPNIVTVFDFETDGQYSYLVMEYVDGLNLADLLARVEDGVLSFDECAHVVDSIASALAYAHENGVLHLDIKPANIMIDRAGTVKLGDFGMATLASAAGYGDARGGTVGYMPPEQIEGAMVDERTDIFSLAVVVWQALAGRCPYAASTPEQSLELERRGPSPALSRVEPDLAGVVEGTLLRALDPNPTLRMSSVEEFARDLVSALGDTQDGAESLADLLNQTEEHAEPSPLEDWGRINVPITQQFPWLGGTCIRVLSAATAAYLAWRLIPYILPESAYALWFGTAGVAAASAAWPPLTGPLGLVALMGAILAQPSTMAFPLVLVIALVSLMWWVLAGRRRDLAGAALLLPSCISSPLAGVGLAGFALPPGVAFLTGSLSWLLCLTMQSAFEADFLANTMLASIRAVGVPPRTWIMALGCGMAALVCSALSQRRRTFLSVFGQILAILVLFASYATSAYVENASIAGSVDGIALGIAVFLGATLCIVGALAGDGITN